MRDILQARVNCWALSDLIRARICEPIRTDGSLAYVENHSFNCPRINAALIVARSRPNRHSNVDVAGYDVSAQLALAPEAPVFSEDLDNFWRLPPRGADWLSMLLAPESQ